MPTYEYHCRDCDMIFEEFRVVSKRDDPATCPECKMENTEKIISTPQMHIMTGEGSDSQRRKEREDKKLQLLSSRAKKLKDSGKVPMEEKITAKDRRIQD